LQTSNFYYAFNTDEEMYAKYLVKSCQEIFAACKMLAVQVVEVVNMPNVAYANGRELPSAPPIAPFVIVQELRYILMGRTESGDIFCSSHIKILSIMQNNFPLRTLVHIHQNAL
jgi:hypothetical protein